MRRGGAVLAGRGAEYELTWSDGAAADVSADEVPVESVEVGRSKGGPGEDGSAEAGSEALDLGFDTRQHVFSAAVGDVAVCPGNVVAGGCARGVKESGLGEQDEGALGCVPVRHGVLGRCNVFECAAEMDGCGLSAFWRGPGDGCGESVIDFEDAWAVAVAFELATVGGGERVSCAGGELEELARGDVAEDEVGVGEVGELADGGVRVDATAKVADAGGEGIGEGLSTATGDGPADRVG